MQWWSECDRGVTCLVPFTEKIYWDSPLDRTRTRSGSAVTSARWTRLFPACPARTYLNRLATANFFASAFTAATIAAAAGVSCESALVIKYVVNVVDACLLNSTRNGSSWSSLATAIGGVEDNEM